MILRIVEILQQKGTGHKTLLIVSCSIYLFLIWVSETNETVFFQFRLDMSMLRSVDIFQQKETDQKPLLIVFCSICLFLIWVSETNETVFFKFRQDMSMLKTVEIFQQNGTDPKTLLIVSCSLHSFLIWVSETNQFSSRFDQISGCSKLLKYFSKKGQIMRRFLLFLVPSIRFSFESLKLIK